MMKMMILAGRRAGMTHEQFRRYVIDVHGPLVRSVPEVAGDIRHYHYNFPRFATPDTAFDHPVASELDIVTQGWFDSLEAQLSNMARPRYLEIIRPDEHRFADGARAVMHYTHEVSIMAGESRLPAAKAFYFRRRREDLSREAFQAAWRTRFADAMLQNSSLKHIASAYLQNHTLPESDHPHGSDPKYFDVLDELFLHQPHAPSLLREDKNAMRTLAALEHELLAPGSTRCLITETVANIP